MNLEGAVRMGMKKQLAAIEDPKEREAALQQLIAVAYQRGKALSVASLLEVDAVIDPAQTRTVLLRSLRSVPVAAGRARRFIDTW